MTGSTEVLVIGAGPAGIGAALAASAEGARVTVLDEARVPGGQVYRAPPPGFAPPDAAAAPEHAAGEALRAALAGSAARVVGGTRVWSVTPGFRLDALGPEGACCWHARTLIVAAGTSERLVPFTGWTTPGVVGLGAATVMLKAHRLLPGRRPVVAGAGPLLAAVAAGMVKAGAPPAAVVDLAAPRDWLGALPALAARPDLLARGLGWRRALLAARVPWLYRHTVVAADGNESLTGVTVAPVDAHGRALPGVRRRLDADCLAIGHGLVPATEVTRLLGAAHRYRPAAGGWVPVHDAALRTTVEGLFVAGDGAGIAGAAAAEIQGRLAGLGAALALGRIAPERHRRQAGALARRLRRAERAGRAMAALMAMRPAMVEDVAPGTVICRCEEVTRAEIEAALDAGAAEVNQLKAWTRCGMGPCQGRVCGESAAALVAARVGGRERAGTWTVRPPLGCVPMSRLVGAFDYDDIPMPEAAPP